MSIYRALKPGCIPFPKVGDPELDAGIPRNYEIFDPLGFLTAVTQHIPNKGEQWISDEKKVWCHTNFRETMSELGKRNYLSVISKSGK